jgi:hypothetical protein
MVKVQSPDGTHRYIRPEVEPVTVKLLSKMDALLGVAILNGQISPSYLDDSQNKTAMVDNTLRELAQNDSNLSMSEVYSTDTSGRLQTAYPIYT